MDNTELTKEEKDTIEDLEGVFDMEVVTDTAKNDLLETFVEKAMPMVHKMIPKAIKIINEDEKLIINRQELIIIGRSEDDGEVFVMQGNKEYIDIDLDMAKMKIDNMESLFKMLLEMLEKDKKKKEEGEV